MQISPHSKTPTLRTVILSAAKNLPLYFPNLSGILPIVVSVQETPILFLTCH